MAEFHFVKVNSNKKAALVAARLNRRHARNWKVGDIIAPVARYSGPDYWAEYEVWGVVGHVSKENMDYLSSYNGNSQAHHVGAGVLVEEGRLPKGAYIVSETKTYGATCAIFTGDDKCRPHENTLSVWVDM